MAPSERALSPQATEGETNNLTATKSQALSPTRFAGAPSQRGLSHNHTANPPQTQPTKTPPHPDLTYRVRRLLNPYSL